MDTCVVIDFETTGLRAGSDRVIEVGAVLLRDGAVVDTFCELMDPGRPIPAFVTGLTGISDAMVRGRPPPEAVMPRLRAFLADHVCVAHNAGFDGRFLIAEMAMAGEAHERPFRCTMLLSRRLIPEAGSHRLGDLARHLRLAAPAGMRAHRALADALVTVELWRRLMAILAARLGREPDDAVVAALAHVPKAAVPAFLAKLAGPAGMPA